MRQLVRFFEHRVTEHTEYNTGLRALRASVFNHPQVFDRKPLLDNSFNKAHSENTSNSIFFYEQIIHPI